MHIENVGGIPEPQPQSPYDGKALLGQSQNQAHDKEVRNATTPEHVRNFLEKNDVAHLLPKHKGMSKIEAYLQKYPKLTFLLGGAAFIASGAAFIVSAAGFVSPAVALGVLLPVGFAVGLVLAPISPAILVPGLALTLFGSTFIGLPLCVGAGVLGAQLGAVSIAFTSNSLEVLKNARNNKEELKNKSKELYSELEKYEISKKEKNDLQKLLKNRELLDITSIPELYGVEEMIQMAYRIKNSDLSQLKKEELITELVDNKRRIKKNAMEQKLAEAVEQHQAQGAQNIPNILGQQLDAIT